MSGLQPFRINGATLQTMKCHSHAISEGNIFPVPRRCLCQVASLAPGCREHRHVLQRLQVPRQEPPVQRGRMKCSASNQTSHPKPPSSNCSVKPCSQTPRLKASLSIELALPHAASQAVHRQQFAFLAGSNAEVLSGHPCMSDFGSPGRFDGVGRGNSWELGRREGGGTK